VFQARYTLFGRYDASARVSAEYSTTEATLTGSDEVSTGTSLTLAAAWFIGLRF